MANSRYSVFPCSILYGVGGGTTAHLTQIMSVALNTGGQYQEFISGGGIDRAAIPMAFADPTVVVETGDLKTILDITGITAGLSCTGGAVFRYQKRLLGGTFSVSANNVTLTSTVGFIIPTQIRAQQDDTNGVVLSLTYYPWSSDGLTDPLADAINADFTTGPPAYLPLYNYLYHMGPVVVNGTEIESVKSVTVDFNFTVNPFRADGDVYPVEASIEQRTPTITVETTKLEYMSTLDTIWNKALPGNIDCFFWKATTGGTRVAKVTAEHIRIRGTAGAFHTEMVEARGVGDASMRIIIQPTSTLAITTTVAIP